MMKFELINPSDEIHLEASDARVAMLAAILVGDGFYGLKDTMGDTVMGVIAFGDFNEFAQDKFGSVKKLSAMLSERKPEIAECLKSFCTPRGRTSMNDIADRAHRLAKKMTPPQVEVPA